MLAELQNGLQRVVKKVVAGQQAVRRPGPGGRALADVFVLELQRELAAQDERQHPHHHHHHDEKEEARLPGTGSPGRLQDPLGRLRRGAAALGARIRHGAIHASGSLVEGFAEYGLVFATVTMLAEAVDHLVLDEFVPVVGQIPYCVLIAGFARNVSEIVEETRIALWASRGWPVNRLRAWGDWWQARGAFRRSLVAATVPDGHGGGQEMRKPGVVARALGRNNAYTELVASQPDERVRWLMENSAAWPSIGASMRAGGQALAGGPVRWRDWLVELLLDPARRTRIGAALGLAESLRLLARLPGALASAAQHDGHLSIWQMWRLRWLSGRLGRAARSAGHAYMSRAVRREPLSAGEAQQLADDVARATTAIRRASQVVAQSAANPQLRRRAGLMTRAAVRAARQIGRRSRRR